MKLNTPSYYKFEKGIVSLITLIVLSVLAVSIPITTKLVQENQETRSSAATICKCSNSAYGDAYSCSKNGATWKCTTPTATPKPPTVPPTKKPVMSTAELNRAPTATPTKKPTVTPTKIPTSTPCSSSNCSVCSISDCSNQSGCMVGNNGLCTTKPNPTQIPTPTTAPTVISTPACRSGNCGPCADSISCVNSGCNWGYNGSSMMYCYSQASVMPTTTLTNKPTTTPTPNPCSSTNCGACGLTICNTTPGCMVGNNGLCTTNNIKACSGGNGTIMCMGAKMYTCNTTTGIWNSPGTACPGGVTKCETDTECADPFTTSTQINASTYGEECNIVGDYICNEDGEGRLLCIAEGNKRVWIKYEDCPYGCDNGYCQRESCTTGERRCVDSGFQACLSTGVWGSVQSCPYGCNSLIGECKRSCWIGNCDGCETASDCTAAGCGWDYNIGCSIKKTVVSIVENRICIAGQMYYDGSLASKCPSGKCNSSGTACEAVIPNCTDGESKCSGVRMYKCDGGSWVGQSSCPDGTICNSSGTACEGFGDEINDYFGLFEKHDVEFGDKIEVKDYRYLQSKIISQLVEIPVIEFPGIEKVQLMDEELLWNYITGTTNFSDKYLVDDYIMLEALVVSKTYGLPGPSSSFDQDILDYTEGNNIDKIIGPEKIIDFWKVNSTTYSNTDLSGLGGFVLREFPNIVFLIEDNTTVLPHEATHIMQSRYHGSLWGDSDINLEVAEFQAYAYETLSSDGGEVFSKYMLLNRVVNSVADYYDAYNETPEYLKQLLAD